MNIKELENYIELGRTASVCVDMKDLPEYSGFVRTVTFYQKSRVCIEFYPLVFDVHDAIIDYCCQFNSLEDAVHSIEIYTGKTIGDWTNYNKKGDFPVCVDEQSNVNISQEAYEKLLKDACDKKIDLPQNENFKLNWKIHFQSRKQYEEVLEGLDALTRELYKQAIITYGTTT